MIAQKFRLRKWRVQKLLKQPKSKKIGFFIVKYLPNKVEYNRWSIVISKKVEKRAVIRNLNRRQIYEATRLIEKEQTHTDNQSHFDVALIPHKHIVTCNYQKIHQNVSDIFKFLSKL